MSSMGKSLIKKWPELYKRDCQLCGCPLGFGNTAEGKVIALDLRAPVYCPVWEKSDSHAGYRVVRTELSFVDHYATCKKMNKEAL